MSRKSQLKIHRYIKANKGRSNALAKLGAEEYLRLVRFYLQNKEAFNALIDVATYCKKDFKTLTLDEMRKLK